MTSTATAALGPQRAVERMDDMAAARNGEIFKLIWPKRKQAGEFFAPLHIMQRLSHAPIARWTFCLREGRYCNRCGRAGCVFYGPQSVRVVPGGGDNFF